MIRVSGRQAGLAEVSGGEFALGMRLDLDGLERRCAEKVSAQTGDAAHDPEHVRRVVRNARKLVAIEGGRLEVVLPAAWLHDCVIVPKDSLRRAEGSRLAAAQAVTWLREWGWPENLLPDIAHAIEAHSFSAGIAPRTLEARVVQDADRLDALGAIGLARCLMLGGQLGRPLYVADDPFCERRAPDDRAACLDHVYAKLLTLAGAMQTAGGREEAGRRTELMAQFLKELRRNLKPES